jgi:hypothetical protein
MFSKSGRANANAERGNAAVVALCVTTLAVGVVLAIRGFGGGDTRKATTPIAATNIGSGESDANPSGMGTGSSESISSTATSGTERGATLKAAPTAGAAPVPTLPGSVPTIPPEGAVAVAVAVPVVAVEPTPTTTPPVLLGLKTPQAASRNLFDAWRENDRARARRFAASAAVDVIFRQPWGAEVQDDGCSETSKPQTFHCAFVGDVWAWIVVVDQRSGPTGREFIPTRIIVTDTKKSSAPNDGSRYAPPSAVGAEVDPTASSTIPNAPIDESTFGEPLLDPASVSDPAITTLQDPSLLDPAGAAAALVEPSGDVPLVTAAGSGAAGSAGSGGSAGAKAAATPTPKPAKKRKSTVRRPKSAVSSSKSAASTDAGTLPSVTPASDTPAAVTPKKKAAVVDQPAQEGSGESTTPAGGAVKAGAPPVNQVDG